MLILMLFAFLGGIITILSPCILPVLPIILSGSIVHKGHRPLGIITGFAASFTFFTLALSTIVRLTGVSGNVLRNIALFLLLTLGIFLLSHTLQVKFENFVSRLIPKKAISSRGEGFWSGFFIGVSLALIWTPCVGPIMAAIITLSAASIVTVKTVLITFAYALGTALTMLLIMKAGRKILDRSSWIRRHSIQVQKVFGAIILVMVSVIAMDFDRTFQSWVLKTFPSYGRGLTTLERNETVSRHLDDLMGVPRFSVDKYPIVPELSPSGEWFNSRPLSLRNLKGKVVVLDFWTYTCINCVRSVPFVQAWHDQYKKDGLVVIGVHTPEFEFEKDSGNVRKAIADFNITYPVVQDNEYATWNAYHNRFWPAKYFIDKRGRLRAAHFGEGNYLESERIIRKLLKEAGATPGEFTSTAPYSIDAKSPETYLGLERTERCASPEKLKEGVSRYSFPPDLPLNKYALSGEWSLSSDQAVPKHEASLQFRYSAKNVFLVMRALKETTPGKVDILVDDKPLRPQDQGRDAKDSSVVVQDDRLYHLISIDTLGEHTMTLKFSPEEVGLFAFTFG